MPLSRVKRVVVPEMNLGQYVYEVRRDRPRCRGGVHHQDEHRTAVAQRDHRERRPGMSTQTTPADACPLLHPRGEPTLRLLPRLRTHQDRRLHRRRAAQPGPAAGEGGHRHRHRLHRDDRQALQHQRLPRPARPGDHLRLRHQAGEPGSHRDRHHGRRRGRDRRRPPAVRGPAQPGHHPGGVQQLQLRHDRRAALLHHAPGRRHPHHAEGQPGGPARLPAHAAALQARLPGAHQRLRRRPGGPAHPGHHVRRLRPGGHLGLLHRLLRRQEPHQPHHHREDDGRSGDAGRRALRGHSSRVLPGPGASSTPRPRRHDDEGIRIARPAIKGQDLQQVAESSLDHRVGILSRAGPDRRSAPWPLSWAPPGS